MRISDWSSDVCSSDLDGAQRTDEVVGAVVAHDADGLHRQKHGEGLPDRVVKAGLADFVEIDCIRLAQDVELFAGYGTGATDCETRTRERSEEHTSALQSLMRISYAVFCLKTNTTTHT